MSFVKFWEKLSCYKEVNIANSQYFVVNLLHYSSMKISSKHFHRWIIKSMYWYLSQLNEPPGHSPKKTEMYDIIYKVNRTTNGNIHTMKNIFVDHEYHDYFMWVCNAIKVSCLQMYYDWTHLSHSLDQTCEDIVSLYICNLNIVILKLISRIDILSSCENVLRWMPQDFTDT